MDPSQQRERLFFSITPPRGSASPEEAQRIADVTIERLRPLDLDALVVYDIDDESDRNPDERPFPYLPTQDPGDFCSRHLADWDRPLVVYRCVGKYDPTDLRSWLVAQDPRQVSTVFVGSSSRTKPVHSTLTEALALWRSTSPALPLGAVAIPERHTSSGQEHERMLRKQEDGASFFVTQVVYDADAAKSMASDYFYACLDRDLEPAPVVFTLSVCGSLKTLAFLQWLGVDVPRWMCNDMERSDDPLSASFDHCSATAADLAAFCRRLGVPFGFNVESVSIRRAEIAASVQLAEQLRTEPG
ncbi:methylene-tetrahydrofolate reductase-like protein [Motilibacter peucedani]|uniref:Methylenetetrahydrofolate reductase n=1 Tax=Motilibacter peucedani TaxID=598650 RepID=A0A420XU81_9ACTN|nr:methylenetetrahydrofolate reductase [Motilibacter peucedani]RKS80403.1 methylene-tetrahydrofolate reductase-like protein [Motilibacter peucedani]